MGLIRHPSLQPLSRQHRDFLLQAHDLRDAANVIGLRAPDAAKRFLAFWEQAGEAHFRYEENQLIACYANHCDVQHDPAVKTMLRQHTEIRHLIEQLTKRLVHTQDPAPLMAELGILLEEHIRHEERVVFAQIQERVPEQELMALPELSSNPPACPHTK